MTDIPAKLRFLSTRHGNALRFVREDVVRLQRSGFDDREIPDPWALDWKTEGRIEGGRRSVEVVVIPGTNLRVVAKRLIRGGLLGRFLVGAALRSRVEREIAIAVRLLERAVPSVELLALRASDLLPGLPFVRIDYLTAAIAGARDGEVFLQTCRDDLRRRTSIVRAGAVVRSMHEAGIDHVDLNVRNLIVDEVGEVRVLDFGASRLHDPLPRPTAVANLARLWRSCVKRGLPASSLTRSDAVRFLRGYAADDAKALWREVAQRFLRDAGFHRLGWRLFGRD